MLLRRIAQTEKHLTDFIRQHLGVELECLAAETPPRIEFGDVAFPFAFELARTLRQAPGQIADQVVKNIDTPCYVERFVATHTGYVNVFFKRLLFLEELCDWLHVPFPEAAGEKIIIEHTNINPNKAAHIGHLRNATLGDTLARLLKARGHMVEVQNYIDNTGVQVADVVVGFEHLRQMSLQDIQSIEEPFDYYCWDLYAEISDWYREDDRRLQYRDQALKAIENGEEPTSQLAEHISSRIVLAHLKTMLRLDVRYQVLPRESDILHLKFWEEAFRLLKEKTAITYQDEGPHQGCWVMQFSEENNEAAEEKIIVRSNGTVTYVGKDIAYQLWKFGLLEKTFHYRPFCEYQNGWIVPLSNDTPDENTVWSTTTETYSHREPQFGRGSFVYNVIDVRQSYLQRVVVEGLKRLGFADQASRSVHFAYEMVALSPACCKELGIELSKEEREKPYIEVSGRKGLGVKADDLINKLIEKSLEEVNSRQEDLTEERRERIATQIAVGALRYFLLRYTRTSVIAFDFAEALSFEGETGPYLQYSVVRANNIFRKLEKESHWNALLWETERRKMFKQSDTVKALLEDNEVWDLLLQVSRLDETIEQAIRTLEMSSLAKYAFTLAQQFNLFYHKHHILSEEDPTKRAFFLTVADGTRLGLLKTLDLLGIQVPEKM
jgi:arginyl-tRNA synthetase